MTRTFTDSVAVRGRTPLIIEIVGPSGTGKTYSLLELAEGMERVHGGETFLIDTEAGRAKHYASRFKFRHVPFSPPFSPLDYLDAFRYCLGRGAARIIVDSMSHEHTGEGGVLEWHERITGGDPKKNLQGWAKPKAARTKMIGAMLQMPIDFLLAFRAKEKLEVRPGKEPVPLGYMPLGAEELIYEATLSMLLLPGANGVPSWQPREMGEKQIVKLPEQFRELFAKGPQLSAAIGEQLARWANGETAAVASAADIIAMAATVSTSGQRDAVVDAARAAYGRLSTADKKAVTKAIDDAKARIAAAEPRFTDESTEGSAPDDDEQAEIARRESA